jgi:hypothetical protein
MDFNNGKSLFLGINKEGDLISLELNFNDLNSGTKFYNPHYYITPHGYTEIKDSETGEQEARERLEDEEYWKEIGFLNDNNANNLLIRHIDFKEVANEVLNSDGWTMTNGEFYFLGSFEDKEYYINLNWIGRDNKELYDKKTFKKLFISDDDFKTLSKIKEVKESDEKAVLEIKTIFSKYQDKQEIIKAFLEAKQE